MTDSIIALRLDDIGASSKRYEVYSNVQWRFRGLCIFSGDWLFFKYLDPFKRWGPYRELTEDDWMQIFWVLQENSAKLTVSITATWAKSEHELIPFPQKFPGVAALLKEGVKHGMLEIANHGLTHSIIEGNAFKPKWFTGNRKFHREFWDSVPANIQEDHIQRSQEILEDYFGVQVVTLVPPGNVFSDRTLEIASKYGIKYVSGNTSPRFFKGVQVLGNQQTIAFHDRDFVLEGMQFFDKLFQNQQGTQFIFVKDLPGFLLPGKLV